MIPADWKKETLRSADPAETRKGWRLTGFRGKHSPETASAGHLRVEGGKVDGMKNAGSHYSPTGRRFAAGPKKVVIVASFNDEQEGIKGVSR